MISFLYLSKSYLKNFIVISLALALSATVIDLISHINYLKSFNVKVLYSFYIFEDIFNLIYPISLVLAAILSFYQLVVKNHLLALSSFGYSRKRLVKPFIILSILIYLVVILLDFTQFSYANSNAKELLKRTKTDSIKNSFFKYNNSFVYADSLDVVKKELNGVKIYKIYNSKVVKILEFKRAFFSKDSWIAKDVNVTIFKYKGSEPLGYDYRRIKKIDVLKGYYPKVVKLLYEGKRVNLLDGFRALKLLNSQNIDNSKIKSAIYGKLLTPLIAPFLIFIYFAYLPLHKRVTSLGKYLFLSMGSSILVWLILYSLNTLSQSSSVNPDYILPIFLLLIIIYTFYIVKSRYKRV